MTSRCLYGWVLLLLGLTVAVCGKWEDSIMVDKDGAIHITMEISANALTAMSADDVELSQIQYNYWYENDCKGLGQCDNPPRVWVRKKMQMSEVLEDLFK